MESCRFLEALVKLLSKTTILLLDDPQERSDKSEMLMTKPLETTNDRSADHLQIEDFKRKPNRNFHENFPNFYFLIKLNRRFDNFGDEVSRNKMKAISDGHPQKSHHP
jgi:hypothetical protein